MKYRLIKYTNPLNGNYVSYRIQVKLFCWITLRPRSNDFNKDFFNENNATNVFEYLIGKNKPKIEVLIEN